MENHSFILFCVFVITVVASYHVGGRDILFFFQYVLICFLPIFLQYCEHICCVCML